MRKNLSIVLGSMLLLSLTACGGKTASNAPETTAATPAAETLTGSAEGFGGEVTVTLTKSGDTITDCKVVGDAETDGIGKAALDALGEQIVAANGFEIDGVAGATVTSKAVKKAAAAALGAEYVEETKAAQETMPTAELTPVDGGVQLGLAYDAAHGTKCFTEAYAAVIDNVIVAAYIDEFQFIDPAMGVTGVPNSDSDFAAGYAEGGVLCSKRDNAKMYSDLMAEKAGSTVAIDKNFDAIQNFVVGKTINEIKAVAGQDNAVDAVSGATLADTAGYLKVIVKAAENAQNTQAVEYAGDPINLKLNVTYAAAHGTKCFTAAAALTDGDTIILSYLDDFQFGDKESGVTGVPNSDADFAAGYAEGKVLYSKRENAEYYSNHMAEKAGSTVAIDKNFDAIQSHLSGMTIADAEALAGQENAADAVSGATLADTAGYVGAVVAAAKK